jgi:hypothetical protein
MAIMDGSFRQACADGDAELIEQLLKLGVRNRSWAARFAARRDQRHIVEQAIELEPETIEEAAVGAAEGDQKALVEYLLTKGANNLDKMAIYAAGCGHKELVDYLIVRGARDYVKMAANAASTGEWRIVQAILAAHQLSAADYQYITEEAAHLDQLDIVDKMISQYELTNYDRLLALLPSQASQQLIDKIGKRINC